MLIQFKDDTELEVVENYDEANDHLESSNEVFLKGSQHEVDLVTDNGPTLDVQFGDGSVATIAKELVQQVILRDSPAKEENTETGDESFFYTVVSPDDPENQERLVFVQQRTPHGPGPVHFALPNSVVIDNQQLWELGCLFLALSGGFEGKVDRDSGAELVEGYGFGTHPELDTLCGID